MSTKKKSITLIHGVVQDSLFDLLKNRKKSVFYILEGRPQLAAAKSVSKQLIKRKIVPTLIADNMAGFLFYKDLVKEVWLSYQCADKNGAICDIGALILGVLGKRHYVPVRLYPSARKTQLLAKQSEILNFNGVRTAPKNVRGYAPLVEWVPRKYISKIYE